MNVLVTGGAGFIGTNLIRQLIEDEHSVVSIDNYSTGLKSNEIQHKNVTYVEMDIRDLESKSSSYWSKFDVVYHLAAIARIQPSFKNPVQYFTTNAAATMIICELCAKGNIPLVYAGSSSYHSGKYKNPYTFSKCIGEEILELFKQNYNLKYSIARFYNVYGPNHLKEGGYCTLIGSWENCIEKNMPLVINGDGSKRRDFTHVHDIINGLVKIKEKEAWGHIFEFGRGKNHSVLEVATMFGKDVIYKNDKPGEAQETLCDYSLAAEVLEWHPTRDLQNYIKNYLNA